MLEIQQLLGVSAVTFVKVGVETVSTSVLLDTMDTSENKTLASVGKKLIGMMLVFPI